MDPELIAAGAGAARSLPRASSSRSPTAESCTGGLVAATLTEIPGSSDVLERGFVTYSNEAKQAMLGVPRRCSNVTARSAAKPPKPWRRGALAHAPVDLAVSITGIAGPGGATAGKPVGLVHFAAASRDGRADPAGAQLRRHRPRAGAPSVGGTRRWRCWARSRSRNSPNRPGRIVTHEGSRMTELARQLWAARRSGGVVHADDFGHPKGSKEAYAVQHEIAAISGQAARGFKVGSTSLEAQRLLGTDEPGSGLLLAPYVHESPARISIAPAHTPAVEGEFAFKLGRDLPPRATPYALDEVAGAVAAVAGAIEVVGTRFSGGLAGKGRWLVTADCGANIAFVSGRWRQAASPLDLRAHAVAMTINGAVRGTGHGRSCARRPPERSAVARQPTVQRGARPEIG